MSSAPELHSILEIGAEIRSVLPASPERAFEVWTRAEHLLRWWGRFAGYTPLSIRSDPRAGGSYELHMLDADGAQYRIFGDYERFEPPTALSYSWHFQRIAADGTASPVSFERSRVDVQFLPHPEGCEAVVTHVLIPDAANCASVSEGWAGAIQLAAKYLRAAIELPDCSAAELSAQPNLATRTLAMDVVLPSTSQEVFQWLTDASLLARWFPERAFSEPHAGGSYRFEWDIEGDQARHLKRGHYLAYELDSALTCDWYPWGYDAAGQPKGPDPHKAVTLVQWRLTDMPDGACRLELRHRGWDYGEEVSKHFASHASHWAMYLENLASVISGGPDLREAMD